LNRRRRAPHKEGEGVLTKEIEIERQDMKNATFGAGCFWGVESAFLKVDGVMATAVGYAGGTTRDPTYEDVCGGQTGHAEVVQVDYDPARVSYDGLLDLFWAIHDPTTLNRQGPDIGSQYRSAIFFHDAEQEIQARASLDRLRGSGCHSRDIVTEIIASPDFYRAEEYHQQYFDRRGRAGWS
jgi:peptide-methionine (S)-S-oxide reductase